ncbi:MAG: 30S ribosome-binding factor RbfA, partial [Halobacteriovoraceae bacterium]|nr:30S ribosome-binding factor RbfA [Halobacteriovoraceae bacterium]
DQIKNEINRYLRLGNLGSTLLLTSVTKVKLSSDYSNAEAYWDTFDSASKSAIAEEFSNKKGKIRSHLAKTLKVRHTPSLDFLYDAQYECETAITDLLSNEALKGKSFSNL